MSSLLNNIFSWKQVRTEGGATPPPKKKIYIYIKKFVQKSMYI